MRPARYTPGMNDGVLGLGILLVWLMGVAAGLLALYLVIKYAVLHALREHTKTSTTGVSIVSANPLRVIQTEPAEPSAPEE